MSFPFSSPPKELDKNKKKMDKSVSVKAVDNFEAKYVNETSFHRGAIITNVQKHKGGWWCGDYGGEKQQWFPARCVEEIMNESDPYDSERWGR